MADTEASTMSKSARKRANQKARAAEGAAEESAPPAPEPAPKSKAAAKPKAEPKVAAAPEPKASAKGKAKAKAEPKAAEPAPKAEAKAKAKGKAEPKAAAEPKAEVKAEPKSKAAAKKAAAKPKAAKPEEPAPEEKKKDDRQFYAELDTGGGGDWAVSSGLSKKASRQKTRQDEKQQMEKEMKAAGVVEARSNQHIPGMAPAAVQLAQIKGAKGKAVVSQSVTSVAVVSAAAVDNKGAAPEKAAVVDNNVSASIKVPENRIGVIVGPKGANIILIKEKTGVKTIDMSGEMCTIVGPADGVALAEHAVRQLIEKGYMSLAYDDFEEEGVPVLPSLLPDIIGSKGCIIQLIKKEAKCEVNIPAIPKNAPQGKKYKVTLAGSKEAVRLGKEIINSIALYGHHELTHPGMIHKEMEVEEWRYRYLIGSKGSEMRHIQNNYKVKVSIPREHSECQNVVIVGEARDVDRAEKYIEKIMYEADQPKGRGAQEKASDDFGDEGPVEDWMKAYMYQRK